MISLIESPLKVYSLLRCFVFAAGMRFCPDGLIIPDEMSEPSSQKLWMCQPNGL
jgi:hypothetical protein